MGNNDKGSVLATFEHDLNKNKVEVTLYNSDTGEVVCSFIAESIRELSEGVVCGDFT